MLAAGSRSVVSTNPIKGGGPRLNCMGWPHLNVLSNHDGDTGDGGRHSSRGVVGTESTPSARHPVPGRRDRRRIGVLKRT
ncbi:unnamed protein product [Boreogadus saida]